MYRLTLENPKILNELIPKLVQTGADNLRVVNLQSNRLEATKLDVAGRASANARQKALTVARQAGGQLGGVVAAVEVLPYAEGDNQLGAYRSMGYDKKLKANFSTEEGDEISTPNLRKIKVKAVYDVVFEVK